MLEVGRVLVVFLTFFLSPPLGDARESVVPLLLLPVWLSSYLRRPSRGFVSGVVTFLPYIRPFGVATFGVLSCWVVGFSSTGDFPWRLAYVATVQPVRERLDPVFRGLAYVFDRKIVD